MRIILLLLLCSTLAFGQQKYKVFEQIDVEKGLSSNWVRDIVQDNNGYIWMATSDGLNRYDGYSIKLYRHNINDPSSLAMNFFHCLHSDADGLIWLGYNGGISKFDPIKDGFVHFTNNPNNVNSIISNKVSDIASDSKGNLWITTRDNGLCQLDKATYNFKSFLDKSNPINNNQYVLICDRKDRVWIGTYYNGILLYDIPSKSFRNVNNGLKDLEIAAIFEAANGVIWVGTSVGGLYFYDEKSNQFIQFKSIPIGMRILTLDEDIEGDLWVSIENKGLFIINQKTKEI